MTVSKPRRDRVQSVDRAVSVLHALSDISPAGASALEVSERTQLDRTVVHRLLKTLADRGLVVSSGPRYELGPAALIFGQTFADQHPARRAVLPYAIDLHARLIGSRPWIISISIPLMDRVVIVERIWGRSTPLSSLVDIGTQFLIDESASGRALLSSFDDASGKEMIGAVRWSAVEQEVHRIRQNGGLSIAHGELRPGMSAIAVPVGTTPTASAALVLAGTELAGHIEPGSDVVIELTNAAAAAADALRPVVTQGGTA